jgi:predicted O-methyltransferase YrrM
MSDQEQPTNLFDLQYHLNQGDRTLNYIDVLNWTNDIPLGSKYIFNVVLCKLENHNNNNPRVLEIGTYTGTSLIHILRTLPNSTATVIDSWVNYNERYSVDMTKLEEKNVEDIFRSNVEIAGMTKRVRVYKGLSSDVLIDLIKNGDRFDFIYVDGSHKAFDVYFDLMCSWKLLEYGGILGIDDYQWNSENDNEWQERPLEAVDTFYIQNKTEIEVLHQGYRVFLKKLHKTNNK